MSKQPTNGELALMLQHITENLHEHKKVSEETNTIAGKTSNRVTTLENVVSNLNTLLTKHDKALFNEDKGIMIWKNKIWGLIKGLSIAGGLIGAGASTIFFFYMQDLKTQIRDERRIDIDQAVILIRQDFLDVLDNNE